jgi:hypothetical protein
MQSEWDLVGMSYTPSHNALEFNRIVGDGADFRNGGGCGGIDRVRWSRCG